MQIPLFLQITDTVMDDLRLQRILIQMKDPNDKATIDAFSSALTTEFRQYN